MGGLTFNPIQKTFFPSIVRKPAALDLNENEQCVREHLVVKQYFRVYGVSVLLDTAEANNCCEDTQKPYFHRLQEVSP